MLVLKTIFWLSAFGLFYIYLGYPLLIWLLAKIRPRPVRKGECNEMVSVVIAAHNEEAVIANKIRSLLASRDAGRITEIIVGSDGSTDRTPAVCREVNDPRVRVVEFAARRGKASVLNDLIPQCKSAIVVLTDARQDVHPDAIGALLSNFADPEVGVVSGELVFRSSGADGGATAAGMGAYWEYEKLIRKSESRAGSVPGATGALYAIRRNVFRPIPADTLLDDVLIPMQAVVSGGRCVFEPGAIVWDDPSGSPAEESVRKRRTFAGVLQLAGLHPDWLCPGVTPIWWEFLSHKLLRLLSPFLLFASLAASAVLISRALYRGALIAQMAVYAWGAAGMLFAKAGFRLPAAGVVLMFLRLNITILLAFQDACSGRFRAAWARGRDAAA